MKERNCQNGTQWVLNVWQSSYPLIHLNIKVSRLLIHVPVVNILKFHADSLSIRRSHTNFFGLEVIKHNHLGYSLLPPSKKTKILSQCLEQCSRFKFFSSHFLLP